MKHLEIICVIDMIQLGLSGRMSLNQEAQASKQPAEATAGCFFISPRLR